MDLPIQILDKVEEFLESLPEKDSAKILAAIRFIGLGHSELVDTKQLDGRIRELIIKRYRFPYFQYKRVWYFVGGFIKKSQKTPKREIENAKEIYKTINSK